MLVGPYSLNQVESYVKEALPGVYIFSRDGKVAAYVGRSDADLASIIRQSAKEGVYAYFWFEYANSPKEAYLKECEYYHKYNPKDNQNHPAAPFGTNWKCPVIGCPFS